MRLFSLRILGLIATNARTPATPHPSVKHFIPCKEYTQAANEKVLAAFDGVRVAMCVTVSKLRVSAP
ncbi:MAG: hypothetical protein JNL98_08445 [Bryobacterales bacterium]|nr:hypothetical protein [Bryobacterales bacterium]